MWRQHGWPGGHIWFVRNGRDQAGFRDSAPIDALAQRLAEHSIRYLYPHLCPANQQGPIPPFDHDQTERFLDRFENVQVMPWVGGRWRRWSACSASFAHLA